jgi:hypothetical protein
MSVNTELDLENKEALKKAAFLAATVNTAPGVRGWPTKLAYTKGEVSALGRTCHCSKVYNIKLEYFLILHSTLYTPMLI